MRRSVKVYISQSDGYFVAECLEINVVTQGKTLDETIANVQEAVALFLDGEDPADFDLVPHPTLLITLEVESPAHAG